MALNDVKLIINDDGFLTENEYQKLKKEYYELYIKMYGRDIYDSLLKVLNLDETNSMYKFIISFSNNNYLATEALEQIKPGMKKEKLSILMAYQRGELIAAARLRKLNAKEGSIPDAVFLTNEKIKLELWKKMLLYIEEYFIESHYQKMYVEVPLRDPILLKGCFDLGFYEDEEDVIKSEGTKTYLLNKTLERTR